MHIIHVALPSDWDHAVANGSYDVSTRGTSIVEADFIHACTMAQLPGVLDRHYRDVPEVELVVLDVARLEHEGATIRWEEPAHHFDPGDGPYPHIYGIVPTTATVHQARISHEPGTPWATPDLSAHLIA
ncbi:MAG: DUF952 domain-containing protein [Actinomycetota bacterium]